MDQSSTGPEKEGDWSLDPTTQMETEGNEGRPSPADAAGGGDAASMYAAQVKAWNYYSGRLCYDVGRKLRRARSNGILPSDRGFVFDCCALLNDLEKEIIMDHTHVRQNYTHFFPELESIVDDPIDYARIVQTIGANAAIAGFNPSASLLQQQETILMTPSMITALIAVQRGPNYKPLTETELTETLKSCKRMLTLELLRSKLAGFVESQMGLLAPNLSALVGTAVAAKLVGTAGGLSELSMMPILNILFLGADNHNKEETKRNPILVGEHELIYTAIGPLPGFFFLYGIKNPIKACYLGRRLQSEASRRLSQGINLAATMDLAGEDETGGKGRAMGEDICKMIDKWKKEDSAQLLLLTKKKQAEPSIQFGHSISSRKLGVLEDAQTFKQIVKLERLTDSLMDMCD